MYQSTFHRATRNIRAINCEGESLSDCKDCYECYWMNESINNRYIESGIVIKDSMDLEAIGPNIEKCYQVCEAQESFGIKFGYFINASVDLEYCYECSDCKYCFGCVGIKKKQFCILNKEYPENEYWALLDEIKSKLLDEGMYGEFFPISCGLYPYNNTFAETNFPLKEEEAKSMGFLWEEKEDPTKIGIELVEANNLPDDINDAADDILQKGIICERSKKPFRVTPFELEFCKKKSIPLPTLHPEERFLDRYKKRSPFKVWTYPCKKCGENTRTSIDPAKNLTIYCETCYQREVG